MISYFSNRHYLELTKQLPLELHPQQSPSTIYYKTFISPPTLQLLQENSKITHKNMSASLLKKSHLKKQRRIDVNFNDLDRCPLCYQDNVVVEFHGRKHVCAKCRSFLRDQHGNQAKLFLNDEGEIVCLGIKPRQFGEAKIIYYYTDYMKLQVSGFSAFATFAGQSELIVLLREKKD